MATFELVPQRNAFTDEVNPDANMPAGWWADYNPSFRGVLYTHKGRVYGRGRIYWEPALGYLSDLAWAPSNLLTTALPANFCPAETVVLDLPVEPQTTQTSDLGRIFRFLVHPDGSIEIPPEPLATGMPPNAFADFDGGPTFLLWDWSWTVDPTVNDEPTYVPFPSPSYDSNWDLSNARSARHIERVHLDGTIHKDGAGSFPIFDYIYHPPNPERLPHPPDSEARFNVPNADRSRYYMVSAFETGEFDLDDSWPYLSQIAEGYHGRWSDSPRSLAPVTSTLAPYADYSDSGGELTYVAAPDSGTNSGITLHVNISIPPGTDDGPLGAFVIRAQNAGVGTPIDAFYRVRYYVLASSIRRRIERVVGGVATVLSEYAFAQATGTDAPPWTDSLSISTNNELVGGQPGYRVTFEGQATPFFATLYNAAFTFAAHPDFTDIGLVGKWGEPPYAHRLQINRSGAFPTEVFPAIGEVLDFTGLGYWVVPDVPVAELFGYPAAPGTRRRGRVVGSGHQGARIG